MSRKSNRVARYSGLALAGAGLAHFTSPRMFSSYGTTPAWLVGFPVARPLYWPMSYREVSVIEIVEILRLWLQGLWLREVARLSGTDARRCAGMSTGRGRAGWTVTAVRASSLMS